MKKKIYQFQNPKKLLNRYFFSDKNHIKVKIRREMIIGIPILFLKIIFLRLDIILLIKKLPKNVNLKQKLINFYSLLLLSRGVIKYSNSILIIGDYQDSLNMAVLQLSFFVENIEFWIINQGTGSIEEKIDFKYPNTVRKIFFPYSKESLYEENLLTKASLKKQDLNFLNIDTRLNLKLSTSKNNLAIFHGYNKKYKLYPIYIFFLIKEILIINFMNELSIFDKVDFFLHPRLKFLSIFQYLNLNRSFYYKIINPKIVYEYKYIISYSPTINSSLRRVVKNSENYIYEFGFNFNNKNIQKCLKKFIERN